MALKDLSGKTVYDLDREDFDKLFCRHCLEYQECRREEKDIHICQGLIDSGIWDNRYRKRLG